LTRPGRVLPVITAILIIGLSPVHRDPYSNSFLTLLSYIVAMA
jgi:hypothetical protein